MREVTEWDIKWFYGAKPILGMWTNSTGTDYYTCANIIAGKFIVVHFTKSGLRFIPDAIYEYSYDEFKAIAPEAVVAECVRIYS